MASPHGTDAGGQSFTLPAIVELPATPVSGRLNPTVKDA